MIAVAGWGLPYLLALPVGLVVAMATGALVDLVVVRRLFSAPRLILTVATLGVAQLLGALQIALPALFTNLKPLTTFTTPSGTPASRQSSARRNAVKDVSSAGLSTTVQPAARAGASFHAAIRNGTFHGMICPTTPMGSRTV